VASLLTVWLIAVYKVDYKLVAHYFGNGATYDTIFNRFRNAIKASKDLIKEAEDRGDPPPNRAKSSGMATPRKSRAAANGATPRKRPAGKSHWLIAIEGDEAILLNSIETPSEDEPEAKKTKTSRKKTVEPKTEDTDTVEATFNECAVGAQLIKNEGEGEV